MRRTNTRSRDWWRSFFDPLVGEVLFVPKAQATEAEVRQIIRKSKVRAPVDILDLACGAGRHALIFAKYGFRVTGLDFSEPYLKLARKAARSAKQTIRFIRGDMRDLKPYFAAGEFDLAVSLFNSFGYFDSRRDDERMLKAVYRVLKPDGAFVINTLNRGGVAKRLKHPISIGREPISNVLMIDAARYDADARRTISHWTIVDARRPKARIVRRTFGQNVYSHAELRKLLTSAGFTIETTWGMLPGGVFDSRETWHQTVLARKRG